MINPKFFSKKHEFLTLNDVIKYTGAKTELSIDFNSKIYDIATLDYSDETQLTFYSSSRYKNNFQKSNAKYCFARTNDKKLAPSNMIIIEHDNPYYAYSIIADMFYEVKSYKTRNKMIDDSAIIGKNCIIYPNTYIGSDVVIGDNCVIGPNCSIMPGCEIGNNVTINANSVISFAIIKENVVIHNGVSIGQDGFGYAFFNNKNHKIIQIGIVEIHNNVEIGANSCIDRGAINNTIIEDDVKIDNLCQIAHNVVIKKGSVIAGCSAIAGSSEIGNFVQIGGGSNISGHIKIGDYAKIAGMTGVTKNINSFEVVAGIPARSMRIWLRNNAKLNKL
jgi:UDP-3-O-[3-hydroxymyristoyl] glucosamine N-acyltransferase